MLHLPNDAPKYPQIPTQHRCLVHQAHGMCHAVGRLQYRHKLLAIHWVRPEFRIHHSARVVERS